MLKKSASFVLASLRPSTYGHGERARLGGLGALTDSPASTNVALIILRAVDLAAAALDGLFEHPVGISDSVSDIQPSLVFRVSK